MFSVGALRRAALAALSSSGGGGAVSRLVQHPTNRISFPLMKLMFKLAPAAKFHYTHTTRANSFRFSRADFCAGRQTTSPPELRSRKAIDAPGERNKNRGLRDGAEQNLVQSRAPPLNWAAAAALDQTAAAAAALHTRTHSDRISSRAAPADR